MRLVPDTSVVVSAFRSPHGASRALVDASANGRYLWLPESLLTQAARHAEQLGVSTEKWIGLALEERMRLEAEDLAIWQARAARASGRSLMEILSESNDNPPDPGDELPEGWPTTSRS